jgi:hypothetical protein
MIYDPEKKLIVLLPPKTGSTSLRSLFLSLVPASDRFPLITWPATSSSAAIVNGHIRYNQILHVFPHINLDEYTIYAFYREPVARFMSAFKYLQQRLLIDLGVKVINGNVGDLKLIYTAIYNNDEDITQDKIEAITIDDIINILDKTVEAPILDLFRPQTFYLTDKVTPLDFEDFDNNATMLLGAFGYNTNTVIPRHNDTNSAEYLSDLTEAQITKIKEIYAGDYAFFESHNITF